MGKQAPPPDEKTSAPLQVEPDQAALPQDIASQRSMRFLWIGLGLAALMFIGVSVCAMRGLASPASAEPSFFVPQVGAFDLANRGPLAASHPGSGHAHPTVLPSLVPPGTRQVSSPAMKQPLERQPAVSDIHFNSMLGRYVKSTTSWTLARYVAFAQAKILSDMQKLRATYHASSAFPLWVIEDYVKNSFSDYQQDAMQSSIFYDERDSRKDVLALATQREPMNIAMDRLYNQSRLEESFGWRIGRYGELASRGVAPNIAIMCRTPVVPGLPGPRARAGEEELQSIENREARVHILNVIAYAFDSDEQPDQIHFLNGASERKLSDAMRIELIMRYERIFDKIFAAAIHYNRDVIVLSRFGSGAFSDNYPGNLFKDIWMPAFSTTSAAWAQALRSSGVKELSLMGGGAADDFSKAVRELAFESDVYANFPEPLCSQLGLKLSGSMIVNAWDPWSFIGNGNFADESLDGFVGRATALAVLGWPITNPYLEANMIPVTRPKPIIHTPMLTPQPNAKAKPKPTRG